MSLIAPLLSLPGRVRKLRGYNAPKLPAAGSISPVVTKADNQSWEVFQQSSPNSQISRLVQAHETHFAFLEGQNNAVELIEPACDITGRGALYGVWMIYSGHIGTTSEWIRMGASVIVDGVELINQAWEWDSRVFPSGAASGLITTDTNRTAVKIPFLGTLEHSPIVVDTVEIDFRKEYVPLLKPLRFDQSLEINLIHRESELLSDLSLDEVTARLCAAVYEDA